MKNTTVRLIGMLLLLIALPLAASSPSGRLPDERALRAVAALGTGADPAVFARSLDRAPKAQDPDLSLRLRLTAAAQGRAEGRAAATEPVRLSRPGASAGTLCALRSQGNISGQVNAASGGPLEGIEVLMIPEGWMDPLMDTGYMPAFHYGVATDAGGNFTIPFDEAGAYRVMAWDPRSLYLPQYYDHAASWEGAAVLSLTEGQTVSGLTFHLAEAGSIAGRVTDASNGAGVWGMYVFAYNLTSAPWDMAWPTGPTAVLTDEAGYYRLDGLQPGDYEVQVYDFGGFYPGAAYPSIIAVAAGQDVPGIDFAITPSATGIVGTITDPTGQPVSGAWVYAATYYDWTSASGMTDAQGRYRLGLSAGTYFVQADDGSGNYLPTYYPGVRFREDAAPVEVADGTVVGAVDFALLPAAKISGRVIDAGTGASLTGIFVQAFDWTGDWRAYAAETDAEGSFTIGGLDPGAYRIQAWDWSNVFSPEWYEDKADYDSADPVAVSAGQTTGGLVMRLDRAGSLSGTVVDALTGTPLADVSLYAWSVDGANGTMGWGWSGSDGSFTVSGLPTGSYILYAYDFSGGYVPTYYDGVTVLDAATPLAVTTGHDTGGIRMRMVMGGAINGHVRDARNGAPIPDAFLTAVDGAGNWSGFGFSAADGSYTVTGLFTGDYYLHAQEGSGAFAPKWYSNADRFEDATAVPVVEGSTVDGIDFALPPAGRITGRVTDTAGQPLAYLTLFAERIDGSRIMLEQFWGYTDTDGRYSITGLGTGDYRVGLLLWNGMVLYFGGSTDPEEAVPVHVVQGVETPGVDFAVGTGGGVRGTVTDAATGDPVEYAEVMVMDGMGMLYSWGGTTADGNYEALWLPPGNYKVMAYSPCYQEEWFQDAATFEEADWVRVLRDAVTSQVDFTLTPVEECVR